VIEFSSTFNAYGYNTETTEFGFRRMSIAAAGVSVIDVTRNRSAISVRISSTIMAGFTPRRVA
jgi:hypothetical protein